MTLPSISYIIATNRPWHKIQRTIDSIYAMGEHDYEILICSPYEYNIKIDNVKFIPDDNISLTYAWNKLTRHSSGDWIMQIADDYHYVNLNIKELLEFTKSEEMIKKTFKMIHMGPIDVWGITNYAHITSTPIYHPPYPVIHFSLIEKKTIDEKLDGVIFNERFIYSTSDHWLGLYCSQNEDYKPLDYNIFDGHGGLGYKMRHGRTHIEGWPPLDSEGRALPNINEFLGWVEPHGDEKNPKYLNSNYNTNHDYQVFKFLAENFKKGITPYNF